MQWDECWVDKTAETELGLFGQLGLPVGIRIDQSNPWLSGQRGIGCDTREVYLLTWSPS